MVLWTYVNNVRKFNIPSIFIRFQLDTHMKLSQMIKLEALNSTSHYNSMKHTTYQPALYHCNFPGCHKACKTPGGLTQHQVTCIANPRNQYIFSPPPGILEDRSEIETPPQTPPSHSSFIPPTPSQSSPQHMVWMTQGRSGIYIQKHPYLDGV